jgi:DNA-binding CsgD family transcriptional regulator
LPIRSFNYHDATVSPWFPTAPPVLLPAAESGIMSERLLFELYAGARDLSVAEFGEMAFGIIRQVLPIHSGMFGHGSYDAHGDVTIHSLHRHQVPVERLIERTRLPGADPAIRNSLAHAGQTVHTPFQPQGQDDTDLERYIRRYDVRHAFTLIPAVPFGAAAEGVTLWTGHMRRSVSMARLVGQAHGVLPHVLLANSINRRLQTGEPGLASAVAALDGVLLGASPAALALLSAEWPDWNPPHLPKALTVLLSARRQFDIGMLGVSASMSNGLLFLRLTRRIAPGLSAAEQRVAALAAAGAAYKEIARECGVSLSTVRNQLHAVYVKLGVRNKTALASLLAGQ